MDRNFSKRILAKAMKHGDYGRDVKQYVERLGEEQALSLMESTRTIWDTPGALKETERYFEREVDSREAGISASSTAVFSVLGTTAIIQEAYEAPKDFPLQEACLEEVSKTHQEPKAWTFRPEMPDTFCEEDL